MPQNKIKIFISGDFRPNLRVNEVIAHENFMSLFNDILPIIQEADISITNLESPLIDNGIPIPKTGPNLKAPIKSIEALKYAGFNMVTLANNHMMDYGSDGLFSTIKICKDNNIRYIGAGSNIQEAKIIQYFNIKNIRIAFINCCENEWSTTNGDTPGCNPLDEVNLFYQIQDAKINAKIVILLIHGGNENYEYPSPRMKKLYRWFIDLGIDAVIGHHTHCFSGYEIYKNKPIIYSLGNFIFDNRMKSSLWNTGVAVVLEIEDKNIDINLLPFTQCEKIVGVHLFNNKRKDEWLNREIKKTSIIQNDILLSNCFIDFVRKNELRYRSYLEPNDNKIILAAKNHGIIRRNIRGKKQLLYLNIIRTEAHREIILELLKNKL